MIQNSAATVQKTAAGGSCEAVPQLEAVEYGFVIVAGAIAFGLVLLARARRRNRHERDELRTHVRRLNGPSDSGT